MLADVVRPRARPRRPTSHGADYRGDIQGLRAIACAAVVLYHAGVRPFSGGYVGVDVFFVISGYLITRMLWAELEAGRRVSLPRFYSARARRLLPSSALVIVATVVAAMVILPPLAMRRVLGDAVACALYVGNIRFAAQNTNYLDAQATPSPLQHYWSLGAEEQFYLLWPIILVAASLVWLNRRRASRRVAGATVAVLAAVSFGLSLWLTHAAEPWAFFSFPTRAWQLSIGALVALAAPVLGRLPFRAAALVGWVGAAAVGWGVVGFTSSTPYPGTAALIPTLGAAAVIAAGGSAAAGRPARDSVPVGPGRLLRTPLLQAGGHISYTTYLWHYPVLLLGAAELGHSPRGGQSAALVLLAVALATATTHLLEDPVRFSRWTRTRSIRSLSVGLGSSAIAVVAALLAGALLVVPHGTKQVLALTPGAIHDAAAAGSAPDQPPSSTPRQSAAAPPTSSAQSTPPTPSVDPAVAHRDQIEAQVEQAVAQAVQQQDVPANLTPSLSRAHADFARPFVDGCFDNFVDAALHPCTYGDTSSATTVVLFGDSHAAQFYPALEAIALAHKWKLQVWAKAVCPPILAPLVNLGHAYTGCDQFRASVIARIKAEHPLLVLLGYSRWYGPVYHLTEYTPPWMNGLTASIKQIESSGAKVVVLGDTEHALGNVPNCLSAHIHDMQACDVTAAQGVNASGQAAEKSVATNAGATFINTERWECTATRCAAVIGNLLVFRDDNHLSATFAKWLAPVLDANLDVVLGS